MNDTNTQVALTERSTAITFSQPQVELIKRTIARDATDDELKLFLAQCMRTGLDPFDRQIYFLKRRQWSAKTNGYEEIGRAETSIDGFRVVADRSGEMDGQEVAWCGPDGAWHDIWLDTMPPAAARVLVYRRGCAKPFPGLAKYAEFVQTTRDGEPNSMWKKMPANQLAIRAEAQALRKAFPKQLSGLYTTDEMAQVEIVPDVPRKAFDVTSTTALPEHVSSVPDDLSDADADESGVREDAVQAPAGFHFVHDYRHRNEWHEADLLDYDAQGGALHVSTRHARGAILEKAETFGVPVRVTTSAKRPPKKGEAYLEKIETFDPALHGAL